MSEESISLQPFCSAEKSIRRYLTKPFSFGSYTYATDGRICIRVRRVANVPQAFSTYLQTARGARDLFKKFPKTGFVQINIPPINKVPKSKQWPQSYRIAQIGACSFNMKFLSAMKRLPSLKVRPATKTLDVMYFMFEGGIGAVMPTFQLPAYTILPPKPQRKDKHAPPKEKARASGNRQCASAPGLHSRRKRRVT